MIRIFIVMSIVFHSSISLMGNSFYIDPIRGSMSNDGSFDKPWSTLQEVIEKNYIETYSNTLPYNLSTNKLVIKNENAPVKAGDTLFLLTGLHGEINLINFNNLNKITVIAYKYQKPVLKKLKLVACKNWVFKHIAISSEPYGEYLKDKLVFIESHGWQGPSSKIDIIDCNIFSATEPWGKADEWVKNASDGIYIKADSINIIGNTLTNIDMGITMLGDYINVINNKVINFSGDGIRLLGSNNLIEGNLVKNCYDVDENHDDGIQAFTTNGLVVDNNIIRSNVILNFEDPNQILLGPLQGIGCFDGIYHNWVIENNVISVNHWHGITLLGADSCYIINNTVLDPSPDITPGGSWIMIDDDKDGTLSTNCVVANNVANSFNVKGVKTNNVVLNSYDEYSNNFVDYSNFDFRLKEGSILIDKADSIYSPKYDILGTLRNFGIAPDVGAYEYETPSLTIEEIEDIIIVSPNPTAGIIKINIDSDNYLVSIFNSKGEKILTVKNNNEIDLSSLSTGIYFIKIIDHRNKINYTKRIVKMFCFN